MTVSRQTFSMLRKICASTSGFVFFSSRISCLTCWRLDFASYIGRISSMPGKFVLWSFGIIVCICAPQSMPMRIVSMTSS